MIKVDIYRNEQTITGFSISGHANTAPRGQDIVCAGVSSLAQTAVLGVTKYLGREVDFAVASGKLELALQETDSLTSAILETMLLGLTEIERLYPRKVRIKEHRR